MSDLLIVCSVLAVGLAAPALAWVTLRGQGRKPQSGRDPAEQEYHTARKREISDLLAAKLSRKTSICWGGATFQAVYRPARDAVWVSNLGVSPYLPSEVFVVATGLLTAHGRAPRGDALRSKLGEPGLPIGSIEGAIASSVFGRAEGEPVFRRITPITALLVHLRLAEYDQRGDCLEAPGMRVAPAVDAGPAEPEEVLHSGA